MSFEKIYVIELNLKKKNEFVDGMKSRKDENWSIIAEEIFFKILFSIYVCNFIALVVQI